MNRKTIHEKYHKLSKSQEKVISEKNFTYKNLIQIVNKYLGNKDRLIDIGCGVGTLDFYLARKGKKVFGIDISKNAIKHASETAELLNLKDGLKFQVVDFPSQKIKDKFELVIATEVLEHMEDDKKALTTINNLLEEGGLLIVSCPSQNAPLYKLGLLNNFDKRVGHLRRYNPEDLSRLLEREGFNILEIRKTEGILRNFFFTNLIASKFIKFAKWVISDLLTFFDNLTIPIFGESQIYIVASKK